uniref:Uncharacterized protein n=1 Tax=Eptatretus burgeri TaxID=7764 RepID=A0A8C4R7C7_EPTBU
SSLLCNVITHLVVFHSIPSGCWIGRSAPILLGPQCSPDLTTCDNALWGYVKAKIAEHHKASVEELKQRIQKVFGTITHKLDETDHAIPPPLISSSEVALHHGACRPLKECSDQLELFHKVDIKVQGFLLTRAYGYGSPAGFKRKPVEGQRSSL